MALQAMIMRGCRQGLLPYRQILTQPTPTGSTLL